MPKLLQWAGNNSDLLSLYGDMPYSDIWTYSRAWEYAKKQWSSGDKENAAKLFGKLRQEMLAEHIDLYPEDPLWRE